MKFLYVVSVLTLLTATNDLRAIEFDLKNFTCSGVAEYGQVVIDQVRVNQENVSITFSVAGIKSTQNYILTERIKNGLTDANNKAFFIGASKSGVKCK